MAQPPYVVHHHVTAAHIHITIIEEPKVGTVLFLYQKLYVGIAKKKKKTAIGSGLPRQHVITYLFLSERVQELGK
jgi:hypothetical protein